MRALDRRERCDVMTFNYELGITNYEFLIHNSKFKINTSPDSNGKQKVTVILVFFGIKKR